MSVVFPDSPTRWPPNLVYSYSIGPVVSSTVVVYDWALTSGQELELVWMQRWSLITALYLIVRCLGVLFYVSSILGNIQSVSVTDAGCTILWSIQKYTPAVVMFILGVVMIIRLYAMYQRSRKMLVFLIVIFLLLTFVTGWLLSVNDGIVQGEEWVLSGVHQCLYYSFAGDFFLLIGSNWEYVIGFAWEVLALCLAVWIVIKHFRELRRQSTGWTMKDCFTVLIKTHVLYFAAFALTSCLRIGNMSPNLSNISSVGTEVYEGFIQIITVVQLFVLGPRLILSIRAYHAQVLADSDQGTAMTTIAFQECSEESISIDV